MKCIAPCFALAALSGLLLLSLTVEAKQARTALVIGNGLYANAPLRNPTQDARGLAQVLRRLGFEVQLELNANQRTMEQAIDEFEDTLNKHGGVGLFYYAGHGIQSHGINYLLPVNSSIERERDLKFDAINVNRIIAAMDAADNDLNIVILDACRNNPLTRSFRSASRGLARLEQTPTGLLIAYSTSPGEVALDGDGQHSPYAQSLMTSIQTPGQHVLLTFQSIANRVQHITKGQQVPWISSSLTQDFYFDPLTSTASANITSKAPTAPLSTSFKTSPPHKQAPVHQPLPDIATLETPYKTSSTDYHWPTFQDPLAMGDQGPIMVTIPTGHYVMGSNDGNKQEKPAHKVNIQTAIAASIYEVSFEQYDRFSRATDRPKLTAQWGRGNQPAINMRWQDAVDYAQWLSQQTGHQYRLPSESEWEYLARAQSSLRYHWSDELAQCSELPISRIDDARKFKHNQLAMCAHQLKQTQAIRINCRHCFSWVHQGKPFPVDSFPANDFGLFNLLGNVAEWTQDCWKPNYYGTASDNAPYLTAGCSHRVIRGGHWDSGHLGVRVSARQALSMEEASNKVGFRVVRDMK